MPPRRSATSAVAMAATRAVVEDVPIIDFVNYVQALTVKEALTGADAALPVISIAAPFNRAASFPQGDVTIRDVAAELRFGPEGDDGRRNCRK